MITVYVDGQRIYMRFTPTPWTLERVKRVPGRRFNPDSKVWTAPATAGVAAAIVREFGADMIDGDDGFAALLGAAQRGEQAQAFKGADGLAQPPIRKTDAWRHQLQAYHFASAVPAAMLDMHMGTGKSRCAVDLIINRGVKRVLICAPASVISGKVFCARAVPWDQWRCGRASFTSTPGMTNGIAGMKPKAHASSARNQ